MAAPEFLFESTMYQIGSKGETRVWQIYVIPDPSHETHAIIVRKSGVLDGKMTETKRVISKGKNIGKKNETSPHQQAVSEAKSIAKKKSEEGYSESMRDRGKVPVILPMLAHDWNKVTKKPTVPLYVQPKIDGVRMIAYMSPDNELTLTTRKGKPITTMEHIAKDLRKLMPPNHVIDGELFTFERTFEEITGIVRRNTPKAGERNDPTVIQYHIFDAFKFGEEDTPFVTRADFLDVFHLLYERKRDKSKRPNLVFVETKHITSPEEIDSYHIRFTSEDGFEGTMYRSVDGPYKIRLRSRDLLKRKDFETDEFRIVDACEADGRDKGTVIWICEASNGTRFNVRPRGSLEMRMNWWKERDSFIGKQLTVRYQNISELGVPRFPVGLAIRDYE